MTLDVLVSVGTDVHRFDRLMDWVQQWYSLRPGKPAMIVQHGRSRAPEIPGATAFLDHDGLVTAMGQARIVVTHGGPASITEARRSGHVPIVVARDPAYGEHVDDHQLLFAGRMAATGAIRLCSSAESLTAALDAGLAAGIPTQRTPIPADEARAAAVARVGRIVDDLVAGKRRRPGRPPR